jgi:cytidylate kinase
VILPKADIKFFFKCDLSTAAKRRFKELKKKNKKIKFQIVKKQLQIRNFRDLSRKNSPLLKSPDAVIVNTGKLRKIPDMMKKMSEIVEKKIISKYGS